MPVLALIIIGAAAGLIATKVLNVNASLPVTIAIGVLGALVGGMGLRYLLAIAGGPVAAVIGAVLGAILVLWLWRRYVRGRF
jgi:uncharacterized membrane protein YeaQ/YmgE (transglycosylase-associated protein family)